MNDTQPEPQTEDRLRSDRMVRLAAALLITALAVIALRLGASILVPVAEAILVWFILNAFARALRQMPVLGPRLTRLTSTLIAIVIIFLLGFAAVWSSARSAIDLGQRATSVQTSLDPLIDRIAVVMGSSRADLVDRALDAVGLEAMMQQLVVGMVNLVNQFGIVTIYVAFLLADQAFFGRKMEVLFPDAKRRAEVTAVLTDIGRQIGSYLWIMTKVSTMTAALSYVVMAFFGLENIGFWVVLIFVLNFIPTIGSILGTILPTAYALVQFQSVEKAALLCAGIGAVQFAIGNIVFPRIAGNTLNLSFFVTILCLFVWGALWGIIGMFMAVPLTAMLVLILARFPSTRPIAIILSKTGNVAGPGKS